MNLLHRIEQRLDQKLKDTLRSSSPSQRAEAIEVHRAILQDIASRVDNLGRGRLTFAYSHLQIRVLLPEPARRRSYELVFVEGDALARDVKSYFDESGIEYPSRLRAEVELVDDLPTAVKARGFDITYNTAEAPSVSAPPIEIRLTLLIGNAEQNEYCFRKQRINLGRLSQVLDANLRTVRTNDVALKDEATGPNVTASRTHAHMQFDPAASRFRLFDDGSAHGTTVLRDGSVIPVPKGASNGVLLQSGDEIVLGQVRMRFQCADPKE